MLSNDVSADASSNPGNEVQQFAQLGPMTGYAAYNSDWTTGDNAVLAAELTEAFGAVIVNDPGLSLAPGTSHTYRVDYNRTYSDSISYYVDNTSTPIFVAGYQYYGGISSAWGSTPTQAQILAETHDNADQMYGDIASPQQFSNSQYWYGSWTDLNQGNQATFFNK